MNLLEFDTPPKFWEYEGDIVEDMGGFFQAKDGRQFSIMKIWEEATPIGDTKPNQEELQNQSIEDSKVSNNKTDEYSEAFAKAMIENLKRAEAEAPIDDLEY